VAIPINKLTSYSFPLATPITPSPTLRQGSNKIAALLAPSQFETKKSKQIISKIDQYNPNEDGPTNFAFNPFDVTPDNTFLDFSNSENNITPLKLWPNDNIGDITFTIADDTSPTTTIQPQQTSMQHELSKTIQKTKSSQLLENLVASGFNAFTETAPTTTVNHGNMTNNLNKVYNPSTVDSKKTSDVRHPSSLENGFCTKDVTKIGSSTATIPNSNKRFDKSDTVVTTNNATSNVTTGYVPSNPDNLTKTSVHAKRVLADGKDDTMQDVLATTTISTTSIENGFAVKEGKEAATTTKKDKTVVRPKTTNDQSTIKDPYFTTKGDGKSMKGKEEPKKNDKQVKFQEKASVHLLYKEEGLHGKSSTTTLDGIRSTLQYLFRKINCAETITSPKRN